MAGYRVTIPVNRQILNFAELIRPSAFGGRNKSHSAHYLYRIYLDFLSFLAFLSFFIRIVAVAGPVQPYTLTTPKPQTPNSQPLSPKP